MTGLMKQYGWSVFVVTRYGGFAEGPFWTRTDAARRARRIREIAPEDIVRIRQRFGALEHPDGHRWWLRRIVGEWIVQPPLGVQEVMRRWFAR